MIRHIVPTDRVSVGLVYCVVYHIYGIYAYMTNKWIIEYYSESVRKGIDDLPMSLKARYFRYIKLMEENGSNIGGSHTKPLRNGLFELRLKGKEGIARAMFCTMVKNRIVILHSFVKKSQKTPKKDIDIAMKRLIEVKKNDDA